MMLIYKHLKKNKIKNNKSKMKKISLIQKPKLILVNNKTNKKKVNLKEGLEVRINNKNSNKSNSNKLL